MLATMATVTSGLLSPNSYGLNPDQMAAKMTAAENDSYDDNYSGVTATSDHLHNRMNHPFAGSNSTDSEPETITSTYHHRSKMLQPRGGGGTEEPKRNKRKNFKPRCSTSQQQLNESPPPPSPPPPTLTECSTNDNLNNNVRRRKTTSTRRLVLDSRTYSPMDLSKPLNDTSDNSSSDSDEEEEDEECNNEVKIPSSFSIHNLSKPHIADLGNNVQHHQTHHHQGQISEMREYAMNTMRELLGIYGLTSEVAESISRQLPIAAFSSGKIFENFTLNPVKMNDNSPPSQPPTPPSTPLSPKSGIDFKQHPNIPNLTTPTHHHQPNNHSSPQIPQNFMSLSMSNNQKPLNLNIKHKTSSSSASALPAYTNGLHGNDFVFGGHHQDLLRSTDYEIGKSGLEQKGGSRGIFPSSAIQLPFGAQLKTELSNSPPPSHYEHQNPLNAMMAQALQPTANARDSGASLMLNKTVTQLDYSKYVKKFSSSIECGNLYCKDLNYREHFHCLDCNSRVFIKKEEMIRHFKWHKKRDESLQHGFMRYSPLDDCSDRYTNCTHNKKQTHYHCIKENCDKVYISTSDVQMHANYHRKDSAIIQEGFQRYRATEECGASYCAFFGQRTTHFHCRRTGCRYTFKNKSDMEKHKSYHIKDEQLSRDGFKKFMKNEACPFDKCRFSKVCNHIHCIRPQCSYVLHSSGQLFSHKRKHERKDSELAYRKYKLAQSMMKTMADGGGTAGGFQSRDFESMEGLNLSVFNQNSSMSNTESERTSPDYDEGESAIDLTAVEETVWSGEDFWKKYCQSYLAHESCGVDKCELCFTDHHHCMLCNENTACANKEAAREHSRNHEQQEIVTEHYYVTVQNGGGACCDDSCQNVDKHYHCNIDSCREVILPTDKPFMRLEHYKMHEYSRKLSLTKDPLTMTHLTTSIDGMFCRKRGRPPKNRVIEVWNDYAPIAGQSLLDSPQAIFTSFKLPKPSTTPSSSKDVEQQDSSDDNRSSTQSPTNNDCAMQGFDIFKDNSKCNDSLCPFLGSTHFHCNQNRCLYVTNKEEVLVMHSRDFHDNVEILDGFEFYDRNVDCRLDDCPSNKINRHFHCTRCNYSFVQYSTMSVHNAKHAMDEKQAENARESVKIEAELEKNAADANKVSVVKASGTFFPLSTLPTERKSPELCKNFQTESAMVTPETGSSSTLYGPELSCSRPFCKLKRKYHYHCNACNQAFSEMDRLVVHVAKHSTGALGLHTSEDNNNQQQQSQTSASPTAAVVKTEAKIAVAPLQSLQNPPATSREDATAAAPPPPPSYLSSTAAFDAYNHFSNFPANLAQQFAFLPQQIYQNAAAANSFMFQHSQLMQSPLLGAAGQHAGFQGDTMTNPLVAMAANLNKRALSPSEMSPEQKKARIQNSMRILKDEPVPEGYLRFRFNEDCQYQHCGYREHQTHFHCQRQDCGYSFCDKTRFVQHTARHERLDTLMGGDFQQYRANVACGRADCAYTSNLGATQNKASHFHCLKCEFVCTDTNKVVAHRRQHQKLDSIQAAGFEKFTPSQQCRVQNCQHGGKQTHYHCLSCQYAVLGLAQMSAHKYRHLEG